MGDFALLQMHHDTMRYNINILKQKQKELEQEVSKINLDIVLLQKDGEKYGYLQNEIKKQKYKKILKEEEIATNEYMQSKWISQI